MCENAIKRINTLKMCCRAFFLQSNNFINSLDDDHNNNNQKYDEVKSPSRVRFKWQKKSIKKNSKPNRQYIFCNNNPACSLIAS